MPHLLILPQAEHQALGLSLCKLEHGFSGKCIIPLFPLFMKPNLVVNFFTSSWPPVSQTNKLTALGLSSHHLNGLEPFGLASKCTVKVIEDSMRLDLSMRHLLLSDGIISLIYITYLSPELVSVIPLLTNL